MKRISSIFNLKKPKSLLDKSMILCVVMLLILLMYAVGFNAYVSTIHQRNYNDQINAEFNSLAAAMRVQQNNIMSIQHSLSVDTDVSSIYTRRLHGADEKDVHLRQYIMEMTETLENYVEANSQINGVYIAMPDVDMVISNEGTGTIASFGLSHVCSELESVLNGELARWNSGIFVGQMSSMYKVPDVYSDMVYYCWSENSYSAVIVLMSRNFLDNELRQRCVGKDMDVYVLNESGDLYASWNQSGVVMADEEAMALYEEADTTISLNGENYTVQKTKVGELYVMALFGHDVLSSMMASGRYVLLLVGFMMLLAVGMVHFAIRRIFYSPLKELLAAYDTEFESMERDEYMQLENVMHSMTVNLQSMEQQIRENEQNMRIKTTDTINTITWEQFGSMVHKWEMFCVFMLVVEDENGKLNINECHSFCRELGRQLEISIVYDRGNVMTGIAGYRDEQEFRAETHKALQEIASKGMFASMGVSLSHRDVQELALAHEECRSAFYARRSDILRIFAVEDQGISSYFNMSLMQQTALASCVASGSVDSVVKCLNAIYTENAEQDNYWHARLSGFLMDLLAVLASNHNVALKQVFDDGSGWIFSHNTELMKRHVYEAYSGLTSMLGGRQDDVIEKVKGYVEEHIADDITLSDAANHVNRSYNYISMRFSEVTGVMFSEYVQKRRIDIACQRLKNTNMSVAEIADSVGYRIPSSFIRLFKKEIGITPGQYREAHCDGHNR